jgi:S-adenosylmethionine decarboxylase
MYNNKHYKQAHRNMHILSTVTTSNQDRMQNMKEFIQHVDKCIKATHVQDLGKVTHQFSSGGYTAVVCLAESHIAVHTWPEFGKVTMDVYLCNYLHDNTEKCEELAELLTNYFQPERIDTTKIVR